ncbi:MAG: DegT/DnrJ/EryC1/StrS family aminotransferase [Microthrixaceae bacterium]
MAGRAHPAAVVKVPVTRPVFGDEEVAAVAEVLASGWVVQGPKVAAFEQLWAEFTGAAFARATTSCTTALHLALLAIGVGPGDEVLVPAFTWIATANAVEYCGATPVFVDVDDHTFNIDPSDIEHRVGERTKAIVPVHEFGLSADMHAVMTIAAARGLRVVEDAACAAGSRLDGQHVGTFGDVGCFSFHPRKAITTGEGGMLTTGDETTATLFDVLRSHGAEESDLARHAGKSGFALPEFARLGFNYRMTDLQAAIGVVQMGRLAGILEARRALAARYDEELSGLPGLRLPVEPGGYTHVYQSYVTFVEDGGDARDRLASTLEEKGVASRQGTHAVHALRYYRDRYGLSPDDFPRAWAADRQSLTLPLFAGMTDEEHAHVVSVVRAAFA